MDTDVIRSRNVSEICSMTRKQSDKGGKCTMTKSVTAFRLSPRLLEQTQRPVVGRIGDRDLAPSSLAASAAEAPIAQVRKSAPSRARVPARGHCDAREGGLPPVGVHARHSRPHAHLAVTRRDATRQQRAVRFLATCLLADASAKEQIRARPTAPPPVACRHRARWGRRAARRGRPCKI